MKITTKYREVFSFLGLIFLLVFTFSYAVSGNFQAEKPLENSARIPYEKLSLTARVSFSDGSFFGYSNFETLYNDVLSRGQEGFEELMSIAATVDNRQFRKINHLLSFFSDQPVESSAMLQVLQERGRNAITKEDVSASLSFVKNMGVFGQTNKNVEEYLINCLINPAYFDQNWPAVKDLTESRLFVDDAKVFVQKISTYQGPEDTNTFTEMVGDLKHIYVKQTDQTWDEIQEMILNEAGDAAQFREVNSAEQKLKLSFVTALFHLSTPRALDVLRNVMNDENEDQIIRDSIEYQFYKTAENGSYKEFLSQLFSNVTE